MDLLEENHEKAEIKRKALRRGKNLTFSNHTCLGNESVVEGDPPKNRNEIEAEGGVK